MDQPHLESVYSHFFQASTVAHGGPCSGQRGPGWTCRLALVILASLGEWAISWGLGVTTEMLAHVDSDGWAWPSGASPWGFLLLSFLDVPSVLAVLSPVVREHDVRPPKVACQNTECFLISL